eukprot:scaffold4354_cov411-Prasinococcus_capsulatus_cf.AAC.1
MLQSDSAPGLPTRRTSINSTPPNSDGERESDQAHAGYANTGITTDESMSHLPLHTEMDAACHPPARMMVYMWSLAPCLT